MGPRAAAAYATSYYYYSTHPEEAATVGSIAVEWATGMDGAPPDAGNPIETEMETTKAAAEAFVDYWSDPN